MTKPASRRAFLCSRYIDCLLLLAASVLLAWLYLALLHGRFWLTTDKRLPCAKPVRNPRVAVVIPARNEADVIGRTIASLLTQDYAGEIHIFLVDDNSDDGTAKAGGVAENLTVIKGDPLPPGWSGKVWAMQQGWLAAQSWNPEWVWLTDADIVHPPDNLSRLLSKAEEGFELVSLMVRLHCEGWAERLMIPAFIYFFFMLYPPAWIADPRRKTAGAAGGCVLLRAESLREAHAFESLHDEIIDDCALAEFVKYTGSCLWLGLADEARSVRGYAGLEGIVKMVARTAFNQLDHSAIRLVFAVVGLLFLFVTPIGVSLLSTGTIRIFGALACALMVISYVPVAHFYRSPLWVYCSLPFAACIYLFATVRSAFQYWSGHGGWWKGRAQDRKKL